MRYLLLAVQIVILVGAAVFITDKPGSGARLAFWAFIGLLGLLMLYFNKALSRTMHSMQFELIKKTTTVEMFVKGLNHRGILLLSIGLALVFVGLLFT